MFKRDNKQDLFVTKKTGKEQRQTVQAAATATKRIKILFIWCSHSIFCCCAVGVRCKSFQDFHCLRISVCVLDFACFFSAIAASNEWSDARGQIPRLWHFHCCCLRYYLCCLKSQIKNCLNVWLCNGERGKRGEYLLNISAYHIPSCLLHFFCVYDFAKSCQRSGLLVSRRSRQMRYLLLKMRQ